MSISTAPTPSDVKPEPSLNQRLAHLLFNHPTAAAVRALVDEGARLDQPVLQTSPLNATIYRGNIKAMVPVLLQLGADPLLILGGETAFHAAARAGDTISLRRLIAHNPHGINALDRRGRTPLQAGLWDPIQPIAYKAGVPVWFQTLLTAGADVNAHNEQAPHLFHRLLGRRGTVPPLPTAWYAWTTALLAAGMDPMVPNEKGVPIVYATAQRERFLNVVRHMWAAGATMDVTTPDGRNGWDFVPRAEAVAYRMAWQQHETTLLQTTADQGIPHAPRSRTRL